jgi:orotate phosphoribosyltransferase-like protein
MKKETMAEREKRYKANGNNSDKRVHLTAEVGERIIELSAKGQTATVIEQTLNAEGITIKYRTIKNFLNDYRAERKLLTNLAYAELAAKALPKDSEIISDIITKFKKEIDSVLEVKDYKTANMLAVTLLNYIKTRRCMGDIDGENDTGIESDLMKKLMSF